MMQNLHFDLYKTLMFNSRSLLLFIPVGSLLIEGGVVGSSLGRELMLGIMLPLGAILGSSFGSTLGAILTDGV
jgi:hypothetical protein